MKLKLALIMMIGVILALGFAGAAMGQSWCDTVALSGETGQPGATIGVSGTAYWGDDVTVTFDGTVVAAAVADEYNEFSTSFVVPADATVGDHEVIVTESGEGQRSCTYPFAVLAATAPAAEVPVAAALPATLPATGFMLVPAGGLLASGLGILLFRKRRR
ncbi:MAG: LPXTG cell wall anchor domain-containing protein [Actinobacteria bacterium]|nr:LPXTG cell wall anchor domain-containing protein [Actinomycetota bacterium]